MHRQGYLAENGDVPAQGQDGLRQALFDPLGSSAIRLMAHCAPEEDGKFHLTLQVEAEDLAWRERDGLMRGAAEIVLAEKSAAGRVHYQQASLRLNLTLEQYAAAREKGIPYRTSWKPAADTAAVRILVRDGTTGKIGLLDMRLKRPLEQGGRAEPAR